MSKAFDYSAKYYGLDGNQLSTIAAVNEWPAWKRRKWTRRLEEGHSARFIYKYMAFDPFDSFSMKKIKDLVVDSNLYLASPSEFNDPYEFIVKLSLVEDPVKRRQYFEESARRLLKNHKNILPQIHGYEKKLNQLVHTAMEKSIADPEAAFRDMIKVRDRNGVACFSQDPRSILMWSYYAIGHKGLCLQFNISNDPGVLLLTHKVKYRETMPSLTWPNDKDDVVDKIILNKAKDWEREDEVRYISVNAVHQLLPFDGRALEGIMLGARFDESNVPFLQELLDQRVGSGLPVPKIYQAHNDRNKYKVCFLRRQLERDSKV